METTITSSSMLLKNLITRDNPKPAPFVALIKYIVHGLSYQCIEIISNHVLHLRKLKRKRAVIASFVCKTL